MPKITEKIQTPPHKSLSLLYLLPLTLQTNLLMSSQTEIQIDRCVYVFRLTAFSL